MRKAALIAAGAFAGVALGLRWGLIAAWKHEAQARYTTAEWNRVRGATPGDVERWRNGDTS